MADEVSVTVVITFDKDNVVGVERRPGTLSFTVSGSRYQQSVASVTTSEAALDLGGLTGATLGWMYAKNLDDTNFVELRMGTGAADFPKLKPGEVFLGRLAGDTPWAIADTDTCELEYLIIED